MNKLLDTPYLWLNDDEDEATNTTQDILLLGDHAGGGPAVFVSRLVQNAWEVNQLLKNYLPLLRVAITEDKQSSTSVRRGHECINELLLLIDPTSKRELGR